MHINCPHCQNPIEIVAEQQREVVCPSCGSSIMLDPGKTRTFVPTNAPRRLGKYELLELSCFTRNWNFRPCGLA